ncbi:uncharacterized protein RSE6_14149 [Rhynchosporium secalis]|uniref:Beta-lactamase-related domain-containing protein n=1 Tax=Rhynchosporium secalis TaxID=38038 RepID=A0A1E1MUP8_RHYSE|nr:uncharacterized protein RSE6_14149 [Rhynchosporium secalis]
MASLEDKFQNAFDTGDIPGVILTASDAKGTFKYQKAFGPKNAAGGKVDLDTTFIMASCTKLMTSIAAMQCVERGLISLDEDIPRVLPELKDVQILKEAEPGKEIVYQQKPETAITLRHLLTHTSGMGYDIMDPRHHVWRASRSETPGIMGIPLLARISIPLHFEPGASWVYGGSMDWAEAKPDIKRNLVKMTFRKGIPDQDMPFPTMSAPTSECVEFTDGLIYDDPTADEYGGSGAIGSPIDFTKILDSLLASDGKLLRRETVDQMF